MKKTAAIIGAGPAGLSAAEVLAQAGLDVTIYERMASPARKFLMAGRGGLNLTHSEDFARFLTRYGAAAGRLKPFLDAFGPGDLRDWCAGLGQEIFVGSSGRVFPQAMKASPLLRAWLRRLADIGVTISPRHEFRGFDFFRAALFETPRGPLRVEADVFVLALGGASWPRLGSDGGWVGPLADVGLASSPLRPANCGLSVDWSVFFREKFNGQPLKNIALRFGDHFARGECVITRRGLEGGAVYALSGAVRDALGEGPAEISIDLRPDVPAAALAQKLSRPREKQSMANFLRKAAGLTPLAITLLRESGPLPQSPEELAARIKAAPLRVTGVAELDRAISTAGGVLWDGVDEKLMAKNFPGLFVAGEMLDWEAPTGGYLLTACLATGRAAGYFAADWAKETRR